VGLRSISVHGNKLSYATVAALREACQANKRVDGVDASMSKTVEELAPCEPALAAVEHQLNAERAQMAVAAMQLSGVERQLAELREEQSKEGKERAQLHAAAASEVEAADRHTRGLAEAMEAERVAYEEEKAKLEEELRALLARRSQLERLDRSPPRPGRKAVELAHGQELPPALDEKLTELRDAGDLKEEELASQAMREKRAYANVLWAQQQLDDIRRVVGQAKQAATAKKGK
jgi:chromosome segregation ATPase